MPVETIIEDARWRDLGLADLAESAARAVFAHIGLDLEAFEIAVLGCDDTRIAALNADFRGKPDPTNVLSWPSQGRSPDLPGSAPVLPVAVRGQIEELGDIAIAYQTCLREADAAGRAPSAHVCHLLVHGVLHLLGYDHMTDADAALMEGLEVEILASMGLEDPY